MKLSRTVICGENFDPIPKIIHQTWKTDRIPDAWKPYQASWLRAHPGWQYVLWTDEANRRLIAERYPWFLPVYEAFPREIQRVDAARYFILYTHGGVYADLDCECVKPLDPLMARGGAIVSRTRDGVIDCAVIASSANHPFWQLVFRRMQTPTFVARLLGSVRYEASHVLFTTGTRMLNGVVREYRRHATVTGASGLTIYAPRFFSGRSWLDRYEPFDDPEAFVRHHYADSWLRPREQRVHRWFTKRAARWATGLLLGAVSVLIATC